MKNDSAHSKSSKKRQDRKSKNYDKEFTNRDKDRKEIMKLRRKVSHLRSIIDKFDLERHHDLTEIIDRQEKIDHQEIEAEQRLKINEDKWHCHNCEDGILRRKIFEINDYTVKYWRKCDMCSHRTKAKNVTQEELSQIVKRDSE